MTPLFEIENFSFKYPSSEEKYALDDISFSVEKGEYLTVCGRSGCGKTTLLRHLKSVLTPHGKREGKILFYGTELKDVSLFEQSSKIGYVMQNPDSQIVTDKVWHELAFGLESLGCDQRTMRLRVAEMASYFGIQSWFNKNVSELSGGQRQLVFIAQALVNNPRLLVMDEPTSALDLNKQFHLLDFLKQETYKNNYTTLLTLHHLDMAAKYADKLVIINDNKVYAEGPPREVFTPKMLEDVYRGDSEVYIDSNKDVHLIALSSTDNKQEKRSIA